MQLVRKKRLVFLLFFFAPVDVREVTLGGVRFQHETRWLHNRLFQSSMQHPASSLQPRHIEQSNNMYIYLKKLNKSKSNSLEKVMCSTDENLHLVLIFIVAVVN